MDLRINQGIKVSRSSRPTRYFEDHLSSLICKDFGNPKTMQIAYMQKSIICKKGFGNFVPKSFRTKVKKFRTKENVFNSLASLESILMFYIL